MGQRWDSTGVAFDPATWAAVLRVLKPGGHLLAFGGSRTYHRLACAIEDAGFEIRDQIMWLYSSGFPKSLDVAQAIDRAGGASVEQQARLLRRKREEAGFSRADVAAAAGCTESSVRDWEEGPRGRREWPSSGSFLRPNTGPGSQTCSAIARTSGAKSARPLTGGATGRL